MFIVIFTNQDFKYYFYNFLLSVNFSNPYQKNVTLYAPKCKIKNSIIYIMT